MERGFMEYTNCEKCKSIANNVKKKKICCVTGYRLSKFMINVESPAWCPLKLKDKIAILSEEE